MVPEIVRLERAGMCGCGELVAAGERAGYAAPQERIVCLGCLADLSDTSTSAAIPRRVAGVVAPLSPWMAPESVIVATLDALRKDYAQLDSSELEVLHVPAEWSAVTAPASTPSEQVVPSAASAPVTPATLPSPAAPETAEPPAAVQANPAPAQGPRRRAGLFTRILTVRSFRAQSQARANGKPDAAVAALLDAALETGVLSLHHRQMPGCRGRMEHIAVGASGIYVIDVKHFKNASIEVRPADDPTAAGDDLVVGGRVLTAAVVATTRRVDVVQSLLAGVGLEDVPVHGVLCFVDGLLPLGASELEVGGVQVLRPTGLTSLVASAGSLSADDRETLRLFLDEQLPASD